MVLHSPGEVLDAAHCRAYPKRGTASILCLKPSHLGLSPAPSFGPLKKPYQGVYLSFHFIDALELNHEDRLGGTTPAEAAGPPWN